VEIPKVQLRSGSKIPALGFGTWKLEGGEVGTALKEGYRLIDTAKIYGNESRIGRAVKAGGVSRGDIFITTKLWPSDFVVAMEAFTESLKKLDMDYVDLYLIHWPNGSSRKTAWTALTEIKKELKARAIGVSNYTVEHLKELMKESEEIPAVNQIEFHPFNFREQKPILDFCRQHAIIIEAYSPLAQGNGMDNPAISAVARAHQKTPAQVMLRWAIQHGTVPIPRSSNPERIKSNLQVFDFELTAEEMTALDDLS
jgi:diketogulonate reductase-like aldo/keto reductase